MLAVRPNVERVGKTEHVLDGRLAREVALQWKTLNASACSANTERLGFALAAPSSE